MKSATAAMVMAGTALAASAGLAGGIGPVSGGSRTPGFRKKVNVNDGHRQGAWKGDGTPAPNTSTRQQRRYAAKLMRHVEE